MKKHSVMLASYGEGYEFLKKHFGQSHKLKWFELNFDGGSYDKKTTYLKNIPRAPYIIASNLFTLGKIVKEFKPDLIVSDFDVNGVYVGEFFGVPVVTLSNMHLLNFIEPPLEFNEKLKYYLTEKPVLKAFLGSDYFFISSIFKPSVWKENTFFFNPVVRREFAFPSPEKNGHTLVYLAPDSVHSILPALKSLKEKEFIVYGNNEAKAEGNVRLKEFSSREFCRDLKQAESVICHGGISIISEATVLKKPMCVFSPKNFFERYFNGFLVQKLGFGELHETVSKSSLQGFFSSQRVYSENLESAGIRPANREVVEKIGELI